MKEFLSHPPLFLEASLFSDFFAVSARKSNLTLKTALPSGGAVFCGTWVF
jgi:hypothetical protein